MFLVSLNSLFRLAGILVVIGAFAINVHAVNVPRERILLDSGWRFQLGDPPDVTTNVTVYPELNDLTKLQLSETNKEIQLIASRPDPVATHAGENVSFVLTNYNDSAWRSLDLPHDWMVELPFTSSGNQSHGYKAASGNTIGWYRRTFTLPTDYTNKVLWLEFDGTYRNSLIWFNGHCVGRNVSGYSSIHFDVTPYANPGGTNVLVVRVDATRDEGWFYEGGGIYRHVWLVKTEPVHVAHWGTIVTSSVVGSNATVTVRTELTNQSALAATGTLTSTILDANSNAVTATTSAINLAAGQGLTVTQILAVANARLWSLQSPYLYKMVSTVSNATALVDVYETPFGVRTVSFDPDQGVILNGQRVEIKGMCNHQDHAGVGSALPDRLQYFRIEKLKEMGVNAYRTSHNPPTPELLDACDRLGMLVLDETRRLGYDPESLGQLERMIRRDRNHPSVFAWSLGNEENTQGSSTGAQIMQSMQNLAHQLDATRQCTVAMNGGWGSGFSTVIDVQGFNYNNGGLDGFHSAYPTKSSIGTEVASTVTTRGIYTNDTVNGYVMAYDIQNAGVGWGATAESWWSTYSARPWVAGGFVWTGFDYRGEPTPYNWPCINSHFGIMDMCGFPKDLFYYYQANWTFKNILHLFPHWNWAGKEGQPINVWTFGNCEMVELFLNGVSQGRRSLDVLSHAEWNVPYAAGTLQAVGYRHGQAVVTNIVETTGTPAGIRLIPDRNIIFADGRDLSMVTVQVIDAQGRVVPTANNAVNFAITGGAIIGVGNGDPSSHEADKATQRSVFNGLAQVIVQSTNQPGSITLTATSPGLASTNVTITAASALPPPPAPTGLTVAVNDARVAVGWNLVPGATGYNLKRATTSGGSYTVIASNIAILDYADTAVSNFVTYYYVVSAINAAGESVNSTEINATPSPIVSGLTATITNSQVLLRWNATTGANYNLKRSLITGGPYTVIAAGTTSTNFTDPNVSTCQTYFYVVTITNAGIESLNSTESSATPPGPLPSPLQSTDIGSVSVAGSASYCGGQFTVEGSGDDIWNNADAFQFVYAPMNGDGEIRARVVSVEATHPNAKAGVMIRETLTAGSRHALVNVTPGVGIEFIRRTNTAGSSSVSSSSGLTSPYWVRLTRTNNNYGAYRSTDGNSWTQIGSTISNAMSASAYAGLAVNAHNNGVLNSSVFDNVFISFVTFSNPPVIAQNPADVTRYLNGTATFSAAFSGSTPLTYQWRRNGTPVADGTSSGLSLSLVLTNVTAAQAGAYTLYVTNAYGFTNTSTATLTVLTPAPGGYTEMIVTNQPVSYWRFNESGTPPVAFDLIGGNDLLNAGVVSTQGVQGLGLETTNNAARYNGSNAGSQSGGSLMNAMNRFTLCGWFKAVSMPQPQRTALFGQNDLVELGFHNVGTGSPLGVWVAGPVAGPNGNGTLVTNQTATLNSNTWYFVATTADGTNINLYLNGNLLNSSPGTMTNYYSSTYSFRAGYGALDATGNYFNGVIDEIALFDRALTASQLQSLYLAALAGGPIRLQIQLISDKVILTWPLDHTGWQLQVQTNAPGAGLATNWNAVAGSVLTNQFTMPLDPANGSVFFRLLHP